MERKLEIHKDKTLKDAVSVAHKVKGWSPLFFVSHIIKASEINTS